MADTEKRRLFIGGLHHALKEQDLKDRFGRHGTISSLEIKIKKDTKGNPIKTFAHMDITLSDNELKKCMSIYNNTKWNGNTMQIQMAKESSLMRLERERTAVSSPDKEAVVVRSKKPSHQVASEKRLEENFEKAGVSEFMVKGKVPGTQIEGEKNWVVGKYGRVLPVVYIRRKDKQKVVCCDPSKFSHHLKKFKDDDKADEGIGMPKVEQLTWDLPESHTEVSMKRKGIFPQARPLMTQRKRVKDDLAVKRDQLACGKLPVRGLESYDSGQSDSEFDDDDDDDEEDDDDRFLMNEDHVQANAVGAEQPTDFEIVRGSASPFIPKAKSNTTMFESEPGYDSDDRDSVDTDELCTLVRSSNKFPGSQTNGGLKRKDVSKTASPTEDKQAGSAKMKRVKQAHREEENSKIQDDSAELGGKTGIDCDATTDKRHTYNEDEINRMISDEDAMDVSKQDENCSNDEGPVPSLNFKPLILDRSHLQGDKNSNDLSVNQDDDDEDDEEEDKEDYEKERDEEEEVSDDQHEHDTEEGESALLHFDEGDDDQQTLGSPIARFDFQPLILDRAAISKSMSSKATEDLPEVECHGAEKTEVSDDSESEEDNEEDDSDGKSYESSDEGEMNISTVDGTKIEHNNELNKKEKSRSTEAISKTSRKVTTSDSTQDVEKSLAGLELKSDMIDQKMFDKSGRLLSKAAKKKLAREEAERQRQANERRLESMKQQQRALLDRQVAIKGALSAVDDKEKKQGKHITFDSDDEDPEAEIEAGKDETMFAGQKIQGNISLFKSDSDSDDDEDVATENMVSKMWGDEDDDDDDDDDERFKIKPQYEGEAGQKLIRMEARYGGDSRFKLDTRFLDKEVDEAETGAKADVTEDLQDDPSSDLQEEKRRSLAILQNMLGTPVLASSKPVEPNFKYDIFKYLNKMIRLQ